jgi:hypothetical protein
LYTDYAADRNRYGIYVGDVDTHESKRILKQYSSAAYGAGGFLLYVKENLMAQRFDPVRMEVRGEAMLLADQVLQRYDVGHQADFSIARTGIIAVRSAPRDQNELRWIDRATRRSLGSTGAPGFYSNPTLSPNGRQLIATVDGANGAANLWSFDLSTGQPTRISFGPVADFAPLVSPGGAESCCLPHLVDCFGSRSEAGIRFRRWTAPMQQTTDSWSVDGRFVTVSAISRQTKSDVWLWQLGDQPQRDSADQRSCERRAEPDFSRRPVRGLRVG